MIEGTLNQGAPADARPVPRETYLNAGHTIQSWLLTTDHKRIAILYVVSITMFFVLGGVYASFFLDSAPAPTIILILSAIFVAAFYRRQRQIRRNNSMG